MSRNTRKIAVGAAALLSGRGLLAGCGSMPAGPSSGPASSSASAPTESKKLTVVTHDSFALSDELKKEFADSTGYAVTYVQPGDGGALVNQLILSKDSPLGDVVYGIDNTFAGRAISQGVLTPYAPANLPASTRLSTPASRRLPGASPRSLPAMRPSMASTPASANWLPSRSTAPTSPPCSAT